MNWVYYSRIIISLSAACIVGLCFAKMVWVKADHVRNMRVLGLGLLCTAIAWGVHARREEPFKPWLIPVFVGLILCAYGMARTAPGETPNVKVKVKSTESP